MTLAVNPHLARTPAAPIMEVARWLDEVNFPPDRPLLNLSQAAPSEPPPEPLREALARAIRDLPEVHRYAPVLGESALRQTIAGRWSVLYGAEIYAAEVAVTAGCNQAFCAAVASVAAPGDAVMLPVPWYFNHAMWLEMTGIEIVPLPCGADMLPDIEAARAAMSGRVRAIVLVTPNNPTGAEYPPGLMEDFYDLARAGNAVLIVDETYRDFHSAEDPVHGLFAREDWREGLVHLYSFSKIFRLTGHRVGALIAGEARLAEVEKFLDTVAICAPAPGQYAALWGLRNLGTWMIEARAEILARRMALAEAFARELPGWRLLGLGAYFAYVEPPFDLPSPELARRLLREQSLLVLPGTMFTPAEPLRGGATGGREETRDWRGSRQLRIAFANTDIAGIEETARRLAAFRP